MLEEVAAGQRGGDSNGRRNNSNGDGRCGPMIDLEGNEWMRNVSLAV